MMDIPRVSVCVPAYNYAQYVGLAVESVLSQSLEDIECIVVDDASTDHTWSVIERYGGDPRVALVRHETNLGHIRTYAAAMARARGRYIVLLSADDLAVDHDALRLQAELLDDEENVGFVYADFDVVDEHGRRLRRQRLPGDSVQRGADVFRRLLFGNFIQHSGTMVRRRCIDELGGYDERFFHSADWEIWLRICARFDVGHVPRFLYAYRMHPRNMHRIHGYDDSMRQIRAVIDTALTYSPFREERGLRERALATAHVTRGCVYLRRREWRKALRDFSDAFRLHVPSLADPQIPKAIARVALAMAAHQLGDTRVERQSSSASRTRSQS